MPENIKFYKVAATGRKDKKDKGHVQQEHYDKDFDQDSEVYSQSKSNYIGGNDYYNKEKSTLQSGQESTLYSNDRQYDRDSQRSKKMKDSQQSMSSKNKYDPRDIEGRHSFMDSSEYQSYMGSQKGDKTSGYSQKGSLYMDDEPKMGHSHHPYAYTQQSTYSKTGQGHDSGAKKDPKGAKDLNSQYMSQKGQYPPQQQPQGRKGKVEVSNITINPHQTGYYPPPYGAPSNYLMMQGSKHHKGYMQMPHEIGKDDPNDKMNFDTVDFAHQEKIKELMRMNGDPTSYPDMSRRNQGGHSYPQSGEFLQGYPQSYASGYPGKEHDPAKFDRMFRQDTANSKSSKESMHNKIGELEKIIKEREQVSYTYPDSEITDCEGVRGSRREG